MRAWWLKSLHRILSEGILCYGLEGTPRLKYLSVMHAHTHTHMVGTHYMKNT